MSLKKISSFVVMNLKKYELNIFFRVSFFFAENFNYDTSNSAYDLNIYGNI